MNIWLIDTEAKTIGRVMIDFEEEEDGEKTTEEETEHLQVA